MPRAARAAPARIMVPAGERFARALQRLRAGGRGAVKALRRAIGVTVLVFGVVMVLSPERVGELLDRPARDIDQAINLRATWGGTVMGIGALLAIRDRLRPWRDTLAWALLCSMAAIFVARAIGFALDGIGGALQWVWLAAEALIAGACAVYLKRRRAAE